ncbi:MAG TPA: FG-GAP-like repeat-containing protein [Kofleriaceae bacterium]
MKITLSVLSVSWVLAPALLLAACATEAADEVAPDDPSSMMQSATLTPAAVTPALRIMPLGDSITFGVGSSTGSSYRAQLWNLLTGAGDRVDFVGTQRSGQLPDTDNEGHSGWIIQQIADIADGVLASYRPNVVTLHLGTNDMNRNIDVANAPARLGALVDQILRDAPDATVLVATLVPSLDAGTEARVTAYNQAIPGVVAQRASAGKHVRLVSMAALTSADMNDSLHPNDNGYVKMAAAFNLGIQQSLAAGWIHAPVVVTGPTCTDATGGWQGIGQVAAGTGAPASQVQLADFNGDGRDDYLVVAANGSVTAWLNTNGAGGWQSIGQIAGGTGAPGSQVRFADLDGDGKADYLVLADNGAVSAWINNGGDVGGGWSGRGVIATGTGAPASQVRFADIDGDKKADYLVLADNGQMSAWVNNNAASGGGWVGRGLVASGTGNPASVVQLANFNCDGRVDYLVVAPSNGQLQAWTNNDAVNGGGGGWSSHGQVATGTGAPGSQVRFADLDGDGRDDYLVVAANGSITAWLNKGGDH